MNLLLEAEWDCNKLMDWELERNKLFTSLYERRYRRIVPPTCNRDVTRSRMTTGKPG
jgi:hypothetical protein